MHLPSKCDDSTTAEIAKITIAIIPMAFVILNCFQSTVLQLGLNQNNIVLPKSESNRVTVMQLLIKTVQPEAKNCTHLAVFYSAKEVSVFASL